jgi:ferredoxin-NADP reductase
MMSGSSFLPKLRVPKFAATDLRLTLLAKRLEAAGVMNFYFRVEREDGQRFDYHPGQAISLHIHVQGQVLVRTFTIASAPDGSNHIKLTIKATPSGQATHYLHTKVQSGHELLARGPFGQFSLVYSPPTPVLLVGAGSGMTPVMSMLRWLHLRKETVDVVFIQQASTPADLLFTEELNHIDTHMPNLRRFDCVSIAAQGQAWSGVRGRPQRASVRMLVPDMGRRRVFCCGPAGFTELMRGIYHAEGGLPNRFHTETFGTSAELVVDSAVSSQAKTRQTICRQTTFRENISSETNVDDGYEIDIDGNRFIAGPTQNLVDAAAESGIRIPTSCREGNCGTCKLKLLKGEITMDHQGGLSAKEEQQGYILACSTHACSDLVMTRKNL